MEFLIRLLQIPKEQLHFVVSTEQTTSHQHYLSNFMICRALCLSRKNRKIIRKPKYHS